MKLYAVVSKEGHNKPRVLADQGGRLLVFATKAKATSARVEEAHGSDYLLRTWKIVPFVPEHV